MMGRFAATALGFVVSAVVGLAPARAQTQPPPLGEQPPQPVPRSQQPPAHAQPQPQPTQHPADDDAIDDPKVSRRLGTRINVPAPAKPAVTPPPKRPVTAAPLPVAPPPPAPVEPVPSSEGDAGMPTLVRPYTPIVEGTFRPTLPRLKLGLRHFDFVRIGASETADGVAAPEAFNSLSLDVYPVSRLVRVGLSTAFGWQSGTWLANGDYFATQSASIGVQYADLGRFVPFVEGFTGVGYMRRLQFDRTIPTAFWQFGADAGVEVYLARVGYLSFAIGYLRPVNGFAKRQQFTTVFVDTWSFKLGIGI
jgi:hypothetical protein